MLSGIIEERISAHVDSFLDRAIDELIKQFVAQGHKHTGKFINTLRKEIKKLPGVVQGLIYMQDYGTYVNNGVSAANIPFSGTAAKGQGKGTRSKYIMGLQSYFIFKGLSEKEALSAAFATAHKHKKEGMPSKGSFSFSQNGKRTGFIQDSIDNLVDDFAKLQTEIGEEYRIVIANIVKRQVQTFEKVTLLN